MSAVALSGPCSPWRFRRDSAFPAFLCSWPLQLQGQPVCNCTFNCGFPSSSWDHTMTGNSPGFPPHSSANHTCSIAWHVWWHIYRRQDEDAGILGHHHSLHHTFQNCGWHVMLYVIPEVLCKGRVSHIFGERGRPPLESWFWTLAGCVRLIRRLKLSEFLICKLEPMVTKIRKRVSKNAWLPVHCRCWILVSALSPLSVHLKVQ